MRNVNQSKKYVVTHPLSQQHLQDVVRVPTQMKQGLRTIWGVTWNTRGKIMLPLGSASMMVMITEPHQDNPNKDRIALLCVTARQVAGEIRYDVCRMRHDFSKTPFAGAKNLILDPRDEGVPVKAGERPNGSWVRLALMLQHERKRSLRKGDHHLGTVPLFPDFVAGFSEPLEGTDPELWRSPSDPTNKTGMYLIDTQHIDLVATPPIAVYEDFSNMLGVRVSNPVRKLLDEAYAMPNPVRDLADEKGWDLSEILRLVATGGDITEIVVQESSDTPHDCTRDGDDVPEMSPTEFRFKYDRAVDQVLELQAMSRNAFPAVTRDALDKADYDWSSAVLAPDQPVPVPLVSPLEQLREQDAIKLVRRELVKRQPLVNAGTTDEDILSALREPQYPLLASRMVPAQTLYRDLHSGKDSFVFSDKVLQRNNLQANLFPETFEFHHKRTRHSNEKTHA